jgi:adenine-specific DNA-methyltransferase
MKKIDPTILKGTRDFLPLEANRLRISRATDAKRKSQLGQFLTPGTIARFMASLFSPTGGVCQLLDPGAGIGSLSSAFLERCASGELPFAAINVAAAEFDELLHDELANTFESYSKRLPLSFEIAGGDFIDKSVYQLALGNGRTFTHAILNPPYKKINSDSRHRFLLRKVGIEAGNLYSAFLALTLAQMMRGGQVVAIVPRSFCNGPYYRPFRDYLLEHAAIQHIHLFDSRDSAFSEDEVLQENVILRLERGGSQGDVMITTSTDDTFEDLKSHIHAFERIVFPDDPERFIHVPTSSELSALDLSKEVRYSLSDVGVQVSTGPVVDFRLKSHLRNMPARGTVPLLYPAHFSGQATNWPRADLKKPNAIQRNAETEKWLFPNGYYCVVRRFSSKEEQRRIIASVVEPAAFRDADMLGFENHLNVFHENKKGLSEPLARGLSVFLNSSVVDEWFRRFNGHTQVNATDLKSMKYPSRAVLLLLGKKAKNLPNDQEAIDHLIQEIEKP